MFGQTLSLSVINSRNICHTLTTYQSTKSLKPLRREANIVDHLAAVQYSAGVGACRHKASTQTSPIAVRSPSGGLPSQDIRCTRKNKLPRSKSNRVPDWIHRGSSVNPTGQKDLPAAQCQRGLHNIKSVILMLRSKSKSAHQQKK